MSKRKKTVEIEEPPLLKMMSGQKIMSGATGGAGTGHGVTYQINYAILQALNLLSNALSSPLNNPSIIIEPRAISGEIVTRWDIGLQPANLHIEVKVNLTRDDVDEWLKNIAEAETVISEKRYCLVYGEGNNPLLKTVKGLLRIANEKENEDDFKSLVKLEQIKDSEKVLNLLGNSSKNILQRMSLKPIEKQSLEDQIKTSSELIAGTGGGKILVEMLFKKFSYGMEKRQEFHMQDIIVESQNRGIKLHWQLEVTCSEYPVTVQSTIFLLQTCSNGLPVDVLAQAVGCDTKQLVKDVASLIEEGKIIEEDETWRIENFVNKVTHDQESIIFSRALNSILKFIEENKNSERAFQQVDSAITLAKVCFLHHPRIVVHVFPMIDKLLKRIGDLDTVLRVAKLSRDAGKAIDKLTRTDEEVDAIARCYICGISWAYQRMPGQLDEARTAYIHSRKIAEGIGSVRSLAFIDKCLGRLCRMEAEQGDLSSEEKRSKLRESVQLLEDAIEKFNDLQDQSSKEHEIGDSYSLLGRTYLVIGDFAKVKTVMLKAYNYLGEFKNSKEYADLLILHGDLEVKQNNYDEAISLYTQSLNVISDANNAWSEIRARALRQRGLAYKKIQNKVKARVDFQEASKVWEELKRPYNAAEMEWEIILIDEGLSEQSIRELEKNKPIVRVAVANMHLNDMAERNRKNKHVSSRVEPNNLYWESLTKKALKEETLKNLDD